MPPRKSASSTGETASARKQEVPPAITDVPIEKVCSILQRYGYSEGQTQRIVASLNSEGIHLVE